MAFVRSTIADEVAAAFLPAKKQAVSAAAAAFRNAAVLVEARHRAKLTHEEGAELVKVAGEAALAALAAQERMFELHALLSPIRDAWRIEPGAFGPDDTVEPEKTKPRLVSVADAA